MRRISWSQEIFLRFSTKRSFRSPNNGHFVLSRTRKRTRRKKKGLTMSQREKTTPYQNGNNKRFANKKLKDNSISCRLSTFSNDFLWFDLSLWPDFLIVAEKFFYCQNTVLLCFYVMRCKRPTYQTKKGKKPNAHSPNNGKINGLNNVCLPIVFSIPISTMHNKTKP